MIVGHERIVDFLKRIVSGGAPIHGFLFWGPGEIGKRTVARAFAKSLLCQKNEWEGCSSTASSSLSLRAEGLSRSLPKGGGCAVCEEFAKYQTERDFLEIGAEGRGGIGIQEARAVIQFLRSSPQLSGRKVVIIDEADQLTAEAQNALLKTLEEPPLHAKLILVTAKPGRLFETVRSRLVPLRFRPAATSRIRDALLEKEPERSDDADQVARLAYGRVGRATALFQSRQALEREKARLEEVRQLEHAGKARQLAVAKQVAAQEQAPEFLAAIETVFRDRLLESLSGGDVLMQQKLLQLLRKSQWAMAAAEDTNVSKRLLLENLLLSL